MPNEYDQLMQELREGTPQAAAAAPMQSTMRALDAGAEEERTAYEQKRAEIAATPLSELSQIGSAEDRLQATKRTAVAEDLFDNTLGNVPLIAGAQLLREGVRGYLTRGDIAPAVAAAGETIAIGAGTPGGRTRVKAKEQLATEAIEGGGNLPTRLETEHRARGIKSLNPGAARSVARLGRFFGAAGLAATPVEWIFFEENTLPHTLQNMAYLQGPLTLRHIPDEVEDVLRGDPALTRQLWAQGVINDDVYGEMTPPADRVRLLPEED